MDWTEERRIYGWLGKPPVAVIQGSAEIARRWRELAKDADKVARMPKTEAGIAARKRIGDRRQGIIEQAETEWARRERRG